MSTHHALHLKSQTGKFQIDDSKLRQMLKRQIGELFAQHGDPKYHGENMFQTTAAGKVQMYDGGDARPYKWSKTAVLHGYGAKECLNGLTKTLTGTGKLFFEEETEGWATKFWVIESTPEGMICRAAKLDAC